jgi:hypothetical protein
MDQYNAERYAVQLAGWSTQELLRRVHPAGPALAHERALQQHDPVMAPEYLAVEYVTG